MYSFKRVVGDDGIRLTEVTLDTETGNKISERVIAETEMKLSDFDILEKTDLLSVQSVEDDYIERQNVADDFRTLDNAMNVLDSCLTKIQKKDTPRLTTEYRDAGEDPVRTSRRISAPRLRFTRTSDKADHGRSFFSKAS